VNTVYLFRELTREKVRGVIVHKIYFIFIAV
jgi:hypothetical protein